MIELIDTIGALFLYAAAIGLEALFCFYPLALLYEAFFCEEKEGPLPPYRASR